MCGREGTKSSLHTILFTGPPLDIVLKSRGKTSLEVSWKAPNGPNSELIGYKICFRTKETSPECSELKGTKVLSITINDLQPSAMYFVTVSAGTEAGFGEKSLEVSKMTNGGNLDYVKLTLV